MTSCGTFQKLRPLSLLTHLSNSYDSAQLKVFSNSVTWSIYLKQGKITYASHSVEPFDRLDCHLRRLASRIPSLSSETRSKLRLMFENESGPERVDADYQAICWLIERQHLTCEQATILIEGLVKEVIESFLLVEEGSYELNSFSESNSDFCKLELANLVKHAQKQCQSWQTLAPEITSPYQSPCLAAASKNQQLSPELRQKLTAILKGFSFRHLAILLNQDELRLARSLYPYIKAGNILVHPPHPPFDCLPSLTKSPQAPPKSPQPPAEIKTYKNVAVNALAKSSSAQISKAPAPTPQSVNVVAEPINNIPEPEINKKTYKIVCVDDSPAMLKELSYFLDDESFAVSTISDPIKALMQIVRLKPDLILLDVKMAGIDGYELCRLLRNHSFFKATPIIMVTGNTGIIDRVKAKMVGASGYLTKPFTQSDLLKIVFRHLS